MNWGTKIAILYLSFVTLIVVLVVRCFGHKSELEYKDYYAREIRFQQQLDASSNADKLPVPIDISATERSVTLSLPVSLITQGIHGTITFSRPSDASLDREFVLHPGANGVQVLNTSELRHGIYKVMIAFNAGGTEYFKQEVVNLK
jgi:hypothetical protein